MLHEIETTSIQYAKDLTRQYHPSDSDGVESELEEPKEEPSPEMQQSNLSILIVCSAEMRWLLRRLTDAVRRQ